MRIEIGVFICVTLIIRDGILGGYSLHILQPPQGGGGVLGKLRSELRKESWSFSFWGRGGILGKLRSELRKESYSFSFPGGGVLGKAGLGLWEKF